MHSLLLAGREISTDDAFDVLNPASGQVLDRAPMVSTGLAEEVLEVASRQRPDWTEDDARRKACLSALSEKVAEHADELASLISSEQGKPLRESAIEVQMAISWFAHAAEAEIALETVATATSTNLRYRRLLRPKGLVAAITPWNFPLSSASWKISHALRAGNSVIVKPSPYTPLVALRLAELADGILPPGVLTVITGGDDLGKWLVQQPGIAHIALTGSIETGIDVARAAGRTLKSMTLELGGNDPAIVLDDFDLGAMLRPLFWGAFFNCGQVCTAIKRVYVPRYRYNEFVDSLAAFADGVRVGPGDNSTSRMGPVNNPGQRTRVEQMIDDAVGAGAVVASGNKPIDGPGYFVRPTILARASHGMRIVDHEQFGPALPILPYDSVDEAVAMANSTEYGLGASVWGKDQDRLTEIAGDLDCGTVWSNSHGIAAPDLPFPGHKMSGLGVENGDEGLRQYFDLQVHCTPIQSA